jgi:hypothetical protein
MRRLWLLIYEVKSFVEQDRGGRGISINPKDLVAWDAFLAVEYATYILNRLVRPGEEELKSPIPQYRRFFNLPNPETTIKHLRVFGCRIYVYISEDRVTSYKMEEHAIKGYLVRTKGDKSHI